MSEKFEDIKGSIRRPKSKKDRKHNDHKKGQGDNDAFFTHFFQIK
jgi:hypothetical protein